MSWIITLSLLALWWMLQELLRSLGVRKWLATLLALSLFTWLLMHL